MIVVVGAVLLDVGGVILAPHPQPIASALRAAGVAFDASRLDAAHYWGVQGIDDPDSGKGELERYLEAYAARVKVRPEDTSRAITALERLWLSSSLELWRHVVPGACEGLAALSDARVPLGIISNSDGRVEDQLRRYGLCQVGEGFGVPVGAVVDSAVFGAEKPDPSIFHYTLDLLGVEASETVYVGDTERYDVAGAIRAGLTPVHFDPFSLCRHLDGHNHITELAQVINL
jgi:putative hydrolase of the HAD superfamily